MGRVSNARERLMEAVAELIWTGSYGSTTIDQICDKAGVKKGSFYHFFDSKADLAAAALDEKWEENRPELDAVFSSTVPPLERLRRYCDMGFRFQSEIQAQFGCVLGCPLFALGSEVCTQDDRLQRKVQEILGLKQKYLESAIRDAHASGVVHAPDAPAKARAVFAYFQGLLTQARIQNNLELVREAYPGILGLLGAPVSELRSA
jgi:TetR/AcrR family transcriptional repressor of nem operon